MPPADGLSKKQAIHDCIEKNYLEVSSESQFPESTKQNWRLRFGGLWPLFRPWDDRPYRGGHNRKHGRAHILSGMQHRL